MLFSIFAGSIGLLLYIFLVAARAYPRDSFPEPTEEREIRSRLQKEWDTPLHSHGAEDDVYRCGWVCASSEYSERPPTDLACLQRMRGARSRNGSRGIYFLVLKHNSLFLYESEEQTYCAHVVVLTGCQVDLYPHTLLLDEIYQKIHPIRIIKATGDGALFEGRHTLYIYASNSSEKEDWLYALRQALNPPGQTKRRNEQLAEAIFMERLGRYVRGPHVDTASQWLNAIGGRIFYNLFRSKDVERFFRLKFERKSAVAPRPFFLGELKLRSVYPGQSLPMLSKGQLHAISQDGEVTASVDIFYPGGFKLTIATEVRWEIPHLKALIVPIVMSLQVRRLSGRLLLRIKPPPSDRLWYGFYRPPVLDIDVEPVISSTAITWGVIKTGVLKHLQEELAEHALLPNMDDLTLPPLVVGDAFGGQRPFEMDLLPPSLLAEACQLDLSAHGISSMPSAPDRPPRRESLTEGALLDRSLLSGSHSLTDLTSVVADEADLSMESLTPYQGGGGGGGGEGGTGRGAAPPNANERGSEGETGGILNIGDPVRRRRIRRGSLDDGPGRPTSSMLLDGARRSDLLAKERSSLIIDSRSVSAPGASANSIGRSSSILSADLSPAPNGLDYGEVSVVAAAAGATQSSPPSPSSASASASASASLSPPYSLDGHSASAREVISSLRRSFSSFFKGNRSIETVTATTTNLSPGVGVRVTSKNSPLSKKTNLDGTADGGSH